MACEVMEKLGVEKFSIRVSDREFLENLFKEFSEEKRTKIFRCIDKMDKIGEEGVISEIDSLGVNGREVIEKLKKAKEKKALTKRLEELFSCARALGIEEYITFDPFIVRGLDYYTSLVFEIDTGVGVSCGGGGRYDNLIGIFSKVPTPATGISLGISRLVEIMKNPEEGRIRVFIPLLEKSLLQEYYALARFLRKRGVLCEIYCDEKPLRKQLDYANSKKFDFSIFLGREEKEKNVIKIRNMRTGEETLASAPEEVMECLKGTEK